MDGAKKILGIFILVLMGTLLKGGECHAQYIQRGREKNKDLIFMQLRSDLQKTKRPEEIKGLKFAMAEYFYSLNSFYEAKKKFQECAKRESTDVRTLLANIYLQKIAEVEGRAEEAESIKKRLFSKRFILLFHDYKAIKYHSRLGNTYRFEYFLDHIRVYKNGNLFAEIRP